MVQVKLNQAPLVAALVKEGRTVSSVAQSTGLSHQTVGRVLKGQTKKLPTWKAVADELGVSMDEVGEIDAGA